MDGTLLMGKRCYFALGVIHTGSLAAQNGCIAVFADAENKANVGEDLNC